MNINIQHDYIKLQIYTHVFLSRLDEYIRNPMYFDVPKTIYIFIKNNGLESNLYIYNNNNNLKKGQIKKQETAKTQVFKLMTKL